MTLRPKWLLKLSIDKTTKQLNDTIVRTRWRLFTVCVVTLWIGNDNVCTKQNWIMNRTRTNTSLRQSQCSESTMLMFRHEKLLQNNVVNVFVFPSLVYFSNAKCVFLILLHGFYLSDDFCLSISLSLYFIQAFRLIQIEEEERKRNASENCTMKRHFRLLSVGSNNMYNFTNKTEMTKWLWIELKNVNYKNVQDTVFYTHKILLYFICLMFVVVVVVVIDGYYYTHK